ncbi:MAG TPA: STAS domain-containing protein [Solirubrobacteraceae bacterium]|jgi:anti-anti-sigma factor
MERDLTASAVSLRKRRERKRNDRSGGGEHAAGTLGVARRQAPPKNEARISLASVPERAHTLVLKGELHHRSAYALEAEIERLCEEGVTGITLDLRELTYIDSIGIAVIGFRSGLCKRRGYDFAVISGSRIIRRALDEAGVPESLEVAGEGAMAG